MRTLRQRVQFALHSLTFREWRRAIRRLAPISLLGVALFASCKSNEIASSNSNILNVGQSCNPDAGTAGNGCGAGVCLAGFCRQPCISDASCSGDAGVGGLCLTANGQSGCAIERELMCNAGNPCPSLFACGTDSTCHSKCIGGACALNGEVCQNGACYVNPPDGGGPQDASASGSGSGSGSSVDSGSGDASGSSSGGSGSSSGAMLPDGSSCPSAQTQFGNIAVGDANPNFTSSVGVRTATQLLVFSGYNGPDPSGGDGGGDSGGVNLVYWQAFDPVTAKSIAPAQPFLLPDSTSLGSIYIEDVAIAPTGEIALLYSHVTAGGVTGLHGLNAAFLASPSDAGSGALQVQQTLQLESYDIGSPAQQAGQPHVIWSTLSRAFVCSWTYYAPSPGFVKVKKFLATGAAAGGGTDTVPTTQPQGYIRNESGSVGTSGSLFGVAFLDYSTVYPYLTLLDAQGNQVGTSIQIAVQQPSNYWVTVAGTSQGFVFLLGSQPVSEWFVPVVADGGVATPPDGGTFSGFTVSGTLGASAGRAIGDDTGGAGGVGAGLLYGNGVSFMYVQADGITHLGPNQVISHAYVAGDEMAITQFAGSFGVSLYSSGEHLTRMAASGCTH
ncbi:MAG: hypothetical protein M3O46_19510 [Myxococcota bacterium]|nr:hypothetical protein [Myxococcota bacterium]